MKTITKYLLLMAMVLLPLLASPSLASAAPATTCGVPGGSSEDQVLVGSGQAGDKCDESQVEDTIAAIVRILSYIVGIVAIVMILWAGLKYITSGGDSGKVTTAKQTLIYALIGLAVAGLAQVLVNLTVSTASAPPPCPAGQHRSADGKNCVKN